MQDLSIIIPVYNNKAGLTVSLLSISEMAQIVPNWTIKTIIIDDCSTQDNYDSCSQLFSSFLDITLLRLPENSGPGKARQYGLEHANTEYIMFLDAGDILSFPSHFIQLMDLVMQRPDIKMFCGGREIVSNFHQIAYVGPPHNKIHGKIYRLDFLKNYNIHFISERFYSEDIGFNIACRMICEDLKQKTHVDQILDFPKPIATELFDENSITRKDNGEFRFTENYGLGYNLVHAMNIAIANNVRPSIIEIYGYENLVCQYIFFHEAYVNQKYIEKNLEGCIHFYTHFKRIIPVFNESLLVKIYNDIIQKTYVENTGYAFNTIIPKVSFWDFLDLLTKKEQE